VFVAVAKLMMTMTVMDKLTASMSVMMIPTSTPLASVAVATLTLIPIKMVMLTVWIPALTTPTRLWLLAPVTAHVTRPK
jgi:hypothetical protein